jgi:hypothetical protein
LLWFETDDFDGALARVEELGADVVLPRHRNPPSGDGGPNHWECSLRDPDGYTGGARQPGRFGGTSPRRIGARRLRERGRDSNPGR